MASLKILCLTVLLAPARAGWGSAACPYLKSVVPQGQVFMDMAADFLQNRANDCKAFAGQFSEHANVTTICAKTGHERHMTSRDEIEKSCRSHPLPFGAALTLQSVFPSFRTSRMIFEVDFQVGGHSGSGLAQLQFCSQTNKVISAKVLKGVSTNIPQSLRQAGDDLLKATFESRDCSVYSNLMEADVISTYNGEPKLLTRGGQHAFRGFSSVQAACKEKAAGEKRVILSSSVTGQKYFYDAAHKELTILAEKRTEVIFKPGQKSPRPVAIVMQFSEAGKIKAAYFFETEILHIEQKFGSQFGADSSHKDFTFRAGVDQKKEAEHEVQVAKKETTTMQPIIQKVASTTIKNIDGKGAERVIGSSNDKVQKVVTEPSPEDVDIEHALVGVLAINGKISLSLVSGASQLRGLSMCWVALLAIAYAIARN